MAFQSAHRPQPGFQPAVIGLDAVIGVPLGGVQRGGDQLVQDLRIGRGPVGRDLGRDNPQTQQLGEEPPGRGQVPSFGEQHVEDLPILVDRTV